MAVQIEKESLGTEYIQILNRLRNIQKNDDFKDGTEKKSIYISILFLIVNKGGRGQRTNYKACRRRGLSIGAMVIATTGRVLTPAIYVLFVPNNHPESNLIARL